MGEFCNRKLPSNPSPPPTPFGPLRAFIKQWGVRGRRAVGSSSLPCRMEINNRKQTVGRGKVGEQETSDMAFCSVKDLIVTFTSNPLPIMQPDNRRCVSPLSSLLVRKVENGLNGFRSKAVTIFWQELQLVGNLSPYMDRKGFSSSLKVISKGFDPRRNT